MRQNLMSTNVRFSSRKKGPHAEKVKGTCQKTKHKCIKFVQCRTNVNGLSLYKCFVFAGMYAD